MKIRRSICLIVLLLASMVLGLFSGCGKQVIGGAADDDHVVDISISSSYGTTTSNIIREYDLLTQYLPEGYTVEWHTMTSASDMRDALVAGSLDIVCTSLPTFIAAYEQGMELALISFAGSVPIGLYGNDESIRSLSDFDEQDRIAAKSKGNNGHIAFLLTCLDELGDAMALDNQIDPIQEADALALLQSSNDIQASIFSFPMDVKAEEAGLYQICSFNDTIDQYGIGSTYFTRIGYYKDQPEVIGAIRAAQQDALKLIETDPEGVAEKLSGVFDLDGEYILAALTQMPPRVEYSGYDKLAEIMHEIGLIENEPTKFEDLFNYEDIK